MEPYNRIYRRKIPIFARPLSREWKVAPAPLDKKELRALGHIGIGPEVEVAGKAVILEFPDRTPPEDIVA